MRWLHALLWLAIGTVVFFLFLVGMNAAWSRAEAHDFWINNNGYKNKEGVHCCGEGDCQSLKEGEVARVAGGYLIKATKEFVPSDEAQVGEDSFYWRCRRFDGSRRCFFTPTGGV